VILFSFANLVTEVHDSVALISILRSKSRMLLIMRLLRFVKRLLPINKYLWLGLALAKQFVICEVLHTVVFFGDSVERDLSHVVECLDAFHEVGVHFDRDGAVSEEVLDEAHLVHLDERFSHLEYEFEFNNRAYPVVRLEAEVDCFFNALFVSYWSGILQVF
jgi:hypothetical protein